jgi:arylsulfatase A-like enzyme
VPKHPNILVLYCDQMQHDRMGFVDGIAHTPALDALAAEGVHFTHMITEQGQCVPSRAVFQTGRPAHQCGVMVNYGRIFGDHAGMLTSKHRTIANVLADAGYQTVYFGKSHLGSKFTELGYETGTEYDGLKVPDEEAERRGIAHVPTGLRRDYVATDDAVAWLRDYTPAERPLLFFFSTNLPHPPFFGEPKYADLFCEADLPLPRSFDAETFEGKPPYQLEHATTGRHGAGDADTVRRTLAKYYSMIAMMDEQSGRVAAEFRRLGLWDDTLVLFVADHGDMMGAHRTRLKGTLPYDEIYRVPCILKPPADVTPARGVVDDLLSSVQLPGTLLRLAAVDVPDSFTGGDFVDALSRDRHPDDERVFFEHYRAYWGLHPFYGVRTRAAKFIRYYGDDDTVEMYDFAKDPDELVNVAGHPEYADLERRLAADADAWWRDTDGRDVDYYESEFFKTNRHNLAS